MNEPPKIMPPDDKLLAMMTAGELRALVRQEVEACAGLHGPDELVDIAAAANILSVSPDWIYHNVKKLPFARKLGRKLLRFSVKGMRAWMDSGGR